MTELSIEKIPLFLLCCSLVGWVGWGLGRAALIPYALHQHSIHAFCLVCAWGGAPHSIVASSDSASTSSVIVVVVDVAF